MFSIVKMRVHLKACTFENLWDNPMYLWFIIVIKLKYKKRYLALSDIVSMPIRVHHVLNGILMTSSLLQVYSLAWTASGFTSLGRSTFISSLPSIFNTTSSYIINTIMTTFYMTCTPFQSQIHTFYYKFNYLRYFQVYV